MKNHKRDILNALPQKVFILRFRYIAFRVTPDADLE